MSSQSPRRGLPFEGLPSEVDRPLPGPVSAPSANPSSAASPARALPSPAPVADPDDVAPPLYRDDVAAARLAQSPAPVMQPTPAAHPAPAAAVVAAPEPVVVSPPAAVPLAAPQPPAPPRRKRSPWFWVLTILLPLLLIAGALGAWWWVSGRDTPEKAVKGYLTALAEGDAAKAVSYADANLDATFLTDDVLATLKRDGAGVGPITSQQDGQAIFSLAGRQVSVKYPTTEANGVVRLPVAVRTTIRSTVPVTLMGRKVSGDTMLFPGRYMLGSGSPNLTVSQTFDVVDPSHPVTVRPTVALADQGVEAARKAIQADLDRCLAAKQLAPQGCPFQLKQPSNGTINEASITYRLAGESPVPAAKLTWDSASSRAKTSFPITIKLTATGVLADGTGAGDVVQELKLNPTVYVDVTSGKPTVTWG